MRVADPQRARLTIVDDDTIASGRDALNPLGLTPRRRTATRCRARASSSTRSGAWRTASRDSLKHRDPATAATLRMIADQPETKRFGSWTPNPKHEIATFLQRAQGDRPRRDPADLARTASSTSQCGHVSDSPAEADAYKRWYREFAEGIGNHRVVLFYEIDALITAPCLSHDGLKVAHRRAARRDRDALALPHAVVYVDAGAADAHDKRFMARMLRWVGV